jgi:hypothetical protein
MFQRLNSAMSELTCSPEITARKKDEAITWWMLILHVKNKVKGACNLQEIYHKKIVGCVTLGPLCPPPPLQSQMLNWMTSLRCHERKKVLAHSGPGIVLLMMFCFFYWNDIFWFQRAFWHAVLRRYIYILIKNYTV